MYINFTEENNEGKPKYTDKEKHSFLDVGIFKRSDAPLGTHQINKWKDIFQSGDREK